MKLGEEDILIPGSKAIEASNIWIQTEALCCFLFTR